MQYTKGIKWGKSLLPVTTFLHPREIVLYTFKNVILHIFVYIYTYASHLPYVRCTVFCKLVFYIVTSSSNSLFEWLQDFIMWMSLLKNIV